MPVREWSDQCRVRQHRAVAVPPVGVSFKRVWHGEDDNSLEGGASALEARNRLLPEWFNRIRTGQLRLPRFQRFEAWSHHEVSGLLETVLRGLPAGVALILEIGDREPFISRPMVGAPEPTERVTEHLLDGQQRLTALWRSFHDDYEDRTYFVTFQGDEDGGDDAVPRVVGQARWFKNGQRYPLWADIPAEVYRRGYIPLKLLRPGDITREIQTWCDAATQGDRDASWDLSMRIQDLRQVVATYNIPFLSLPAGTPKHVALDVFIKLNTNSVDLSPFDIVVAQVEEAAGQSLHELVAQLKKRVPSLEAYVEPSQLVLNVAALREDRPPTQASYQRLDLKRLVQDWDRIVAGIAWAVDCLRQERVYDAERLPTVAVLPVLAALYDDLPPALDARGNAKALVRKYLWRAFLTRRYENSAATRSWQDLRGLRAVLRDGRPEKDVPVLDESQYPLPTLEELKQAGWPRTKDILARGILAVTLRAGALDLADGTPISPQSLAQREYHHLFPEALLIQDGGLSREESRRALNCALVTWNTNRNIAAKEPLRYLRERVERSTLGENEIRTRLASHLIPYDELAVGDYNAIGDPEKRAARIRQDYERFLDRRAAMVLNAIHRLCSGQSMP